MSVRGTHSDRGRLVQSVLVLMVTAAGLTTMGTSAYFTDTATVTGNTFTTGFVALSATPATNAITLTGMVPGDKVTAPITVTNTGNLVQLYAVSSVTTENAFADQLELTIKTGVTTCTDGGFGTNGVAVYSAGDLGSMAGTKIIGDSAPGSQAGDRSLGVGGSEILCAQVVLPLSTIDTFQNKTTTATLTFNAEQISSALAGTLTGTTVGASWTAVPGASSYTLNRVATTTGPPQFSSPEGVAVDASGIQYLADTGNNRIRKITVAGVVTTLAGSGLPGAADGTGDAAEFSGPRGIAVAANGSFVYVADSSNHRIRKISAAGVVTTLAGSTAGFADATGGAAMFSDPAGLALATSGTLYVADQTNNRIRAVTSGGVVSTYAGSGAVGSANAIGVAATFNKPAGVALDSGGNVYVADTFNHRVRKIYFSNASVITLAGSTAGHNDGSGAVAQFNMPMGVAVSPVDGYVYVTDKNNCRLRQISSGGYANSPIGQVCGYLEGTANASRWASPSGVGLGPADKIYVTDIGNQRLRMVTQASVSSTVAGTGTAGFADMPGAVSKSVYTGLGLSYSNTGLSVGPSYTYTLTTVWTSGTTVSNTIGPFVPTGAAAPVLYQSTGDVTVPAGMTTVHIVVAGGSSESYEDLGGVLEGDMVVAPGDTLHLVIQGQSPLLGGDAEITRNALGRAAWAQGGYGDADGGFVGGTSYAFAQVTNVTDTATNWGHASVTLTFGP